MKQILGIMLLLLFIGIMPVDSWGLSTITNNDLNNMRKNYGHWSGDCPLGDINRNGIGNFTKKQRLIFSESVSYALFSYVLKVKGEDENKTKRKFLAYWNCAKKRMLRKNIKEVYSWNCDTPKYHTWIPMPEHLKDNLLAWRWVEKIQGTNRSGIIYQTVDPITSCNLKRETQTWQDGSQVASDGDLLIAYALYLAYKRGWGKNLLKDAKLMLKDLRQKAVINFRAGEMVNAKKQPKPANLSFGKFYDKVPGEINFLDEPNAIAWQGKNNYVGFWHEPLLDLSNLAWIELKIKGDTQFDFRVQDVVAGKKIGHVYNTGPLKLTPNFQTFKFTPSHFEKFKWYGEQRGNLDWSKIKTLQIQVGRITQKLP